MILSNKIHNCGVSYAHTQLPLITGCTIFLPLRVRLVLWISDHRFALGVIIGAAAAGALSF